MCSQLPPCWKVQDLQITTKQINLNANINVAQCQGAEMSSSALIVCHLTIHIEENCYSKYFFQGEMSYF